MSIKLSGDALPAGAVGGEFSKDSVDWKSYKKENGIVTNPAEVTEEVVEEEKVEEPEKKGEEEVVVEEEKVEEPEEKKEEVVEGEKKEETGPEATTEEEISLEELQGLRQAKKQYSALLPEFTK